MGSLHHKVAVLVPDEKLNCFFIFDAQLFTKQNELSFIREQWSHLEDDASHCCRKVFLGSAQPINRNQAFLAQEKVFLRSAGKAVTKKTSSCYDFVFKIFFARKKKFVKMCRYSSLKRRQKLFNDVFCRRRNVVDKKSTKNGTATEQYFPRTFQKIS